MGWRRYFSVPQAFELYRVDQFRIGGVDQFSSDREHRV